MNTKRKARIKREIANKKEIFQNTFIDELGKRLRLSHATKIVFDIDKIILIICIVLISVLICIKFENMIFPQSDSCVLCWVISILSVVGSCALIGYSFIRFSIDLLSKIYYFFPEDNIEDSKTSSGKKNEDDLLVWFSSIFIIVMITTGLSLLLYPGSFEWQICMNSVIQLCILVVLIPFHIKLASILVRSNENLGYLIYANPDNLKIKKSLDAFLAMLLTGWPAKFSIGKRDSNKRRCMGIGFYNMVFWLISDNYAANQAFCGIFLGFAINFVLSLADITYEYQYLDMQKKLILFEQDEAERRDWMTLFLHLIKQPVTDIHSIKEQLNEEGMNKDIFPRLLAHSSEIDTVAEKLTSIINLRKENATTSTFDIKNLIQKALDVLQLEKSIDIDRLIIHDCEETIYIDTNANAFYIAVGEFIRNSLKHSPDQSPVNVFIQTSPNTVCLEIKNTIKYNQKSECEKRIYFAQTFGEGKPLESIGNMDIHIGLIEAQARIERIHKRGTVQYSLQDDCSFNVAITFPRRNITENEFLSQDDEEFFE